ncbi:TPA: hypothetical protein IAC10_08830 [Candidatus Scatousia excrementigallinarum]|uniref:Uncharacterized protein n=1 Tax=Candidatus Scatousia excrementigallinarum TaxID=2840935 RepID=A0A9D1EZC5_9BACT|nr:hypothetical protein [Candidatus Scatousia excrementigallinarum]
MENLELQENGYIMSSIDEYFEILDQEAQKRSKMVAKSLTKYLKRVHSETKFDKLKASAVN